MNLDGQAISRLYRAHAAAMLAFFMRRTFDPEASVDLVAETFAAAFANRLAFRGSSDSEALAWMYAIARNRLTDFRRRGQVERRALARLGFQRRELDAGDIDRIEELAGLGKLREQIGAELGNLAEQHREALRLRIVEERPYAQVAVALGVSEPAARVRVSRAVSALREALATRGDDVGD
jgi:RNA polymerase sigma-70 factor (ECF subfamily)